MYNNFEISLVVFKPNITTNHAITHTNTTRGNFTRLTACEITYTNLEISLRRGIYANCHYKSSYYLYYFYKTPSNRLPESEEKEAKQINCRDMTSSVFL